MNSTRLSAVMRVVARRIAKDEEWPVWAGLACLEAADRLATIADLEAQHDAPTETPPPPATTTTAQVDLSLAANTKQVLEQALALHGGNKRYAAQTLGISRRALYRLLERHGMDDRISRRDPDRYFTPRVYAPSTLNLRREAAR